MRKAVVLALALVLSVPVLSGATHPVPAPLDGARAVNVMPPGQSGHVDVVQFAVGLATGDFGAHFADQLPLYASFAYKPMQMGSPMPGHRGPSDGPGALIARDRFGVPAIFAPGRGAMFEAMGYAQAQDRLFEMEIFRRAGHGTLAEMLGEAYVPMDIEVRTLSEGPDAREAELAAADPQTRADLEAFSAGVNRYIGEALLDPRKMPVEFVLLADLPIAPWTPDDTLAFGEFAGRFFGEFGHAELEMAAELARLREAHGAAGDAIFDDLYPLDDSSAPPTVPASAGVFPRHVGVPGGSGGIVNFDTSRLGTPRHLSMLARGLAGIETRAIALRRSVGLHGFGSNQYVVDARHTANGNPLLVSEPQTGWAVPSFFWEVELHSPDYGNIRGVTVPGLAFVPIGRNEDSGWAVTSGLDANADTFAESLNSEGTAYLHDGAYHPFDTHTETIRCKTPPTALIALPDTSSVCTASEREITVRRTVHGPLLLEPDVANRVAYSRQSVVDGTIVSSLEAWTRMTQARTMRDFAHAASEVAFGFNFMYVDAAGNAGYFHSGRYPIRPADVDPRLPIPGTGEWDWQGYESFADQPHAVNPPGGFLANWNNRPAAGWYSKGLLFATVPEGRPNISIWGPTHQVEPIQQDLARLVPSVTFRDMARIQRHVSSVDNRQRAWMPALLAAVDASGDASLAPVRSLLAAWNGLRVDTDEDGMYDAAGLAIFDRWVEHALHSTFDDDIEPSIFDVASGFPSEGHLRSRDNGDTPTFKTENALFGTFTHALRGETNVDYFAGSSRDAVLVAALRATIADLTRAQGENPGLWREETEIEQYAALGAGSVPDVSPLVNRGSYGQIIEAIGVRGPRPGR